MTEPPPESEPPHDSGEPGEPGASPEGEADSASGGSDSPAPEDPDPRDDPDPGPYGRAASMASGCALLLFVPGALAWLGFRDRLELVSTEAVGRHGPLASLGLGLAVGLAIAGVLALLARYLAPTGG